MTLGGAEALRRRRAREYKPREGIMVQLTQHIVKQHNHRVEIATKWRC
jgi:hypothetical protein